MSKSKSGLIPIPPPAVALFAGDDTIGVEKAREELVDIIKEERGDGVVEEVYNPIREPFSTFAERMITPSLFSDVRIFHIRNVSSLLKKDLALVRNVIKNDIPDIYLIIECEARSGGRVAITKTTLSALGLHPQTPSIKERTAQFIFQRPPDYKIPDWLITQVPLLFKRKINKPVAEFLVDHVGADLDNLYSELQKIDIHLPPNAPIDMQAVKEITGTTRLMSPFELSRSIAAGDMLRSLEIIESLFSTNFYAPSCVAVLFRHFWALFRIRSFAEKNASLIKRYYSKTTPYQEKNQIAFDIGRASGLLKKDDPVKKAYPVIVLSGIIDQAKRYKHWHVKKIFRWLQEFDIGVKTGRIDANKVNFQILCYKLARIARLTESELSW